jgi:tetratricopeptide (TPR) repeat protein
VQHAVASHTALRPGGLRKLQVKGEQLLMEPGIRQHLLIQSIPPLTEVIDMAKTGRNEPCPCGSGKKSKRCCCAKDEAADYAAHAERPKAKAPRSRGLFHLFEAIDDDLDKLTEASNAVVDLIHAGKLDEAERAAHVLLERFPDVHDGYDRLGMVCEARGDDAQAAEYYRKVIAFAREHPEQYEPGFEAAYQELIEKLTPVDGDRGHAGNRQE